MTRRPDVRFSNRPFGVKRFQTIRRCARAIWAAESGGDHVGHIEISQIWPYLSSRLSRVLVAPGHRRRGVGSAMIGRALSFSFREHHVSRIDLGVSATNTRAIACYERLGFTHVGTWPGGIMTGAGKIDVYWMTVSRDQWGGRDE